MERMRIKRIIYELEDTETGKVQTVPTLFDERIGALVPGVEQALIRALLTKKRAEDETESH